VGGDIIETEHVLGLGNALSTPGAGTVVVAGECTALVAVGLVVPDEEPGGEERGGPEVFEFVLIDIGEPTRW